MHNDRRQRVINDLLKACRRPSHVLTIGQSLCLALLGHIWRSTDDDQQLILRMLDLIRRKLQQARRDFELTQPVSEQPLVHEQQLRDDARSDRSVLIWSVLWAYYGCCMSSKRIAQPCSLNIRTVQKLLKEGRECYIAPMVQILNQRQFGSTPSIDPIIEPFDPEAGLAADQHAARQFIAYVARSILADQAAYELPMPRHSTDFAFIAYQSQATRHSLVTFVAADQLSEYEISERQDHFYAMLATMAPDPASAAWRTPVGLLCFVYSSGCSLRQLSYIKAQTRTLYDPPGVAVLVTWTIDMLTQTIRLPSPVVELDRGFYLATNLIFPTLSYLQDLLSRW